MRGSIHWCVGAVLGAAGLWIVGALTAPANQPEPQLLPIVSNVMSAAPSKPAVEDPQVEPAQFTQPGGPASPTSPGGIATRTVADPAYPVVRIQVRVPADSAPGDELKYTITVQNVSSADAHSVVVRNPFPENVEPAAKAEPEADKTLSNPKQLVWKFGTVKAGATKTIQLTLKPKPDAVEVKNLAYVSFEHGQAVITKINKPTVKVTKVAPKQTVRDEAYTVRIAVDNTGKVAAENVRVIENLPSSAEFEAITKGAKRTDKRDAPAAEGQQWVWEIAKLLPGERKVIEYRVTAREAKDMYALTSLAADKGIADRAEARTLVLVPGLTVKLTGPTANAPVAPGEAAKYEITVRNTGTLPSTNVRVTGTLPADCKPTKKTEGGQLYRDAIQWTLPRLEPGEAQTFRFEVKANTSGSRVVVASTSDARGQRAADELRTLFQGSANLVWETTPDPAVLSVGRSGTFTVKVRNNGGEAARNVRVEVEVPVAVSWTDVKPNVKPTGAANSTFAFGPDTIAAYGEATYTITYEAKQPAQAWFKIKMTADALGDRPMQTEKAIEITGTPK